MKSVRIITQVYPPEMHPTAIMVKELAEYLKNKGWMVDIVCGYPHHPMGKMPEGWKRRIYDIDHSEHYRILRTWHTITKSRSILKRSMVYVTQAIGNALGAILSKRTDIIIVYGPPLVGPTLGNIIAKIKRSKTVNVVYDLYPDIAIETGRVRNPIIISIARYLELLQYKKTDMTIVLSKGFKKQIVSRGADENRVEIIPVWVNTDEIKPVKRDNNWRKENGIPVEEFVVLYAGTIGIISGARVVIEAAKILRNKKGITFLFVGEGEEKIVLENKIKEYDLKNVRLLPYQPRKRLSEVQSTADIGIVTLKKGRGRTSVPSKVQGYMAAGKPIIACVEKASDTGDLIEGNKIGKRVEPENPKELANCIIEIKKDEEKMKEMGNRSRELILKEYAKENVLKKYENKICEMVEKE